MSLEAPRAESVGRAPAGPLRGLVTYGGYDLRGGSPGRHRALPSPFLTFVVTFGPELEMAGPDDDRLRFRACLAGLHDVPESVLHAGRQSGVHVSVHPLAARALFGVPAGALAGLSLESADVLGRLGTELAERMADSEDAAWEHRFAALDDVLLRLLARGRAPAREDDALRRAWSALDAPDAPAVAAVARDVGWSPDHLGRRFRDEFGVGPAVARRIGRFDRARRDIARRAALAPGPAARLDLADVAVTHGYADQAHLAREFRALAGCPPSRWVADEVDTGQSVGSAVGHDVGSVQADGPGGGPSSSS